MVNIEIVPATPAHLRELLQDLEILNEEDKYRFGVDSEEILLKIMKRSIFVESALIEGKIVGIWGLLGEYMGREGRPWSLLSPAAEKYPFHLISFYRKIINKMLQLFPILIDMVDIKHTKILRVLKLMGFVFNEPEMFRGSLFIKATRIL